MELGIGIFGYWGIGIETILKKGLSTGKSSNAFIVTDMMRQNKKII
jgi:hypothetical protein